jgi:hypothetical protein
MALCVRVRAYAYVRVSLCGGSGAHLDSCRLDNSNRLDKPLKSNNGELSDFNPQKYKLIITSVPCSCTVSTTRHVPERFNVPLFAVVPVQ